MTSESGKHLVRGFLLQHGVAKGVRPDTPGMLALLRKHNDDTGLSLQRPGSGPRGIMTCRPAELHSKTLSTNKQIHSIMP